MACALCHRDIKLSNSHIFPEWLYKSLYNKKHQFEVFTIDPKRRNEIKQTGIKEYLLCNDCEQRLSVWETYARELLIGSRKRFHYDPVGPYIRVRGLDYRQFKLFELSILWRAGVSTHSYFNQVKLGNAHQERLRLQLLHSDPGDPDCYGAVMLGLKLGEQETILQIITSPIAARSFGGIRVYNFMFGGFLWLFHIGSTDQPQLPRQAFLREDGSRLIGVVDALQLQSLHTFIQELNRLGRRPLLR